MQHDATKNLTWACVALASLSWAASACADDGYLTTYTHRMREGELEIMVMSDYTSPSSPKRSEGQKDYMSQMTMIDYHVTNQFAVEFMLEWFQDVGTGEGKFTGFRHEARYRLFREEVPLNPTLYVEYEDLDPETRFKMEVSGWVLPPYDEEAEEPSREKILESRLILSQDFGPWNVAFNWISESDTQGGGTAFGYALGVSYRLHDHEACEQQGQVGKNAEHQPEEAAFIRATTIAFELIGALGDSKEFGLTRDRQEHYFQPSLMFHLGSHAMLMLGFAIGLSDASDDIVRIGLGWEF